MRRNLQLGNVSAKSILKTCRLCVSGSNDPKSAVYFRDCQRAGNCDSVLFLWKRMKTQSLGRQSCRIAVVTAESMDYLMSDANGSKLVNNQVSVLKSNSSRARSMFPKSYYTE